LNLVLPSLSATDAIGGVHTALDLIQSLGVSLRKALPLDIRFIVDLPPSPDDNLIWNLAGFKNNGSGTTEIFCPYDNGYCVPTRRADIFMTFNWWTNINIRPVLREQAQFYSAPQYPRLYLIQDYEPQFYSFSAAHLYSLSAYGPEKEVWGVFNSSFLRDYFQAQGNRVAQSFIFEPKLPGAMKPYWKAKADVTKEKIVLVYARPSVERNCYSIIQASLERLFERYPSLQSWRVLSVGSTHPKINLGNNRAVECLGKLSLVDYAKILQKSAVGLSLMASPHPSYPPLEMAHFGLLTITNSYANKDLSVCHPNISSLSDVAPHVVAEKLAELCAKFEEAPRSAADQNSIWKSYLSSTPFDCLDELTSRMSGLFIGAR